MSFGRERHEGLGEARRPDELDLQRAVLVDLNDGSDIAPSQAVLGNVVNKDDGIEQAECHDLYAAEKPTARHRLRRLRPAATPPGFALRGVVPAPRERGS